MQDTPFGRWLAVYGKLGIDAAKSHNAAGPVDMSLPFTRELMDRMTSKQQRLWSRFNRAIEGAGPGWNRVGPFRFYVITDPDESASLFVPHVHMCIHATRDKVVVFNSKHVSCLLDVTGKARVYAIARAAVKTNDLYVQRTHKGRIQ